MTDFGLEPDPNAPTPARPPFSVRPAPTWGYLATCAADDFAGGPDLDELIVEVQSSLEREAGEDVAVWRGSRLVAVLRHTGEVVRYGD